MHNILLRTSGRIAGLALFTVFLLTPALAQSTGGVKGKVRNLRGDRIGGVTITARQNGSDIKSAKSDAKGEFVLSGLDAGFYNIVFDAKGYSTAVKNNVVVKQKKIVDLGDRLFLQIDKGTQVIVAGSVFFKDGTSVTAAKVDIDKVSSDGSTSRIGSVMTNIYGEFTFRRPEGPAKYRMTVKYKDSSASKEIEVDSAMVYRLAISLDITRQDK
jgi:hypothetical protein